MEAQTNRDQQMTVASGLNIIAGIWLIIAPFILGYSDRGSAMWDSIIVGIIVGVLAAIRIWGARDAVVLSWINVVLGIWLIISPWIFSDSDITAVVWNDIILGIIVIVLSVIAARATVSRPV